MLLAIQFTHSKFHLYSRMRSQKLKISGVHRAKCSVNVWQHLALYTSVTNKNVGMQLVKTPVKTPLLFTFATELNYKTWKMPDDLSAQSVC